MSDGQTEPSHTEQVGIHERLAAILEPVAVAIIDAGAYIGNQLKEHMMEYQRAGSAHFGVDR